MMMPSMTRAVLLVGLLMAAPAAAVVTGPRELTTTAVARGVPAAKASPDMYYLAGETGAKETYTLTIKGPAGLTLFTPDGHEMVSATGSGKVTLIAYLPLTDVFTLAVSRVRPGQPYTLSRKATVPTLGEEVAFAGIGYAIDVGRNGKFAQCWITPGLKFRGKDNSGSAEYTLAADHETTTVVVQQGAKTYSYEKKYTLSGNTLTRHIRWPSGKTAENSSALHMYTSSDGRAREYSGYLCTD